jgi:hypothetical protein
VTLARLRAKLGLDIETGRRAHTDMTIEPYDESNLGAVVALSLRAWAPVFESLKVAMGPDVFHAFYRDDWKAAQRSAVESVCANAEIPVWVAGETGRIAGFVALRLHPEEQMGQIYMIAVDPDFQRRGVAARSSSIRSTGSEKPACRSRWWAPARTRATRPHDTRTKRPDSGSCPRRGTSSRCDPTADQHRGANRCRTKVMAWLLDSDPSIRWQVMREPVG